MPKPLVLFVDDVQVKTAMDHAEDTLRQHGFQVGRYASMTALAADRSTLASADVLVVSSNYPCTKEIMATSDRLRAVIFPASGTETIDLDAARELTIVVGHGASPENAESMAESTIMLMLVMLFDLHRSERLLRNLQPRPAELYARMMKGRTIGLVGFGRIGQAIAARLQNWQANLLAYSPNIAAKTLPPGVRAAGLDDLMRQSDIVCVVCALNESTRNLIDARRIALMKPSAMLVNTSRGAIVEEQALADALAEERITRIALDTFVVEPLPADSPLRRLKNAVLTPHIVGHTRDSIDASKANLVKGVMNVLRGQLPPYVRNPDVADAWQQKWAGAPHLAETVD